MTGPSRRRQRREARPQPDRRPRACDVVGRADQGQAAGRRERAADALHAARGDQHLDAAGERAGERGRGEEHDADSEDSRRP